MVGGPPLRDLVMARAFLSSTGAMSANQGVKGLMLYYSIGIPLYSRVPMSENRLLRSSPGACLPGPDAELLKQINHGFSDTWWGHYHELIQKREESLLSDEEHRELIHLTDQVERREAKRLRALVKLAELRRRPLTSLMMELGCRGKPVPKATVSAAVRRQVVELENSGLKTPGECRHENSLFPFGIGGNGSFASAGSRGFAGAAVEL
jgi:hypothetical protein